MIGRKSVSYTSMERLIVICALLVSGFCLQHQQSPLFQDAPNSDDVSSLINSIQNGSPKSRIFYDYQTKIVAYKDLIKSRCLLEFLKSSESLVKQNLSDANSIAKDFFVSDRALSKRQIWMIAGQRLYEFCRGFPTYLVQEINLPSHTINNDIVEDDNLPKTRTITKRETKHFFVGRVRGQTQSQYLNYGNSNNPGKAEAESSYGSSKAVVSGNSGMGQAQSQSSPVGCDDCYGTELGQFGRPSFPVGPGNGEQTSGVGYPGQIKRPGFTDGLGGDGGGERYAGNIHLPSRPGQQFPAGQIQGRPVLPGYPGQTPGQLIYPGGQTPGGQVAYLPQQPVQGPGGQIIGQPSGPTGQIVAQPRYPSQQQVPGFQVGGQQPSGSPTQIFPQPSYPGQQVPTQIPGVQTNGRVPNVVGQVPGYPGTPVGYPGAHLPGGDVRPQTHGRPEISGIQLPGQTGIGEIPGKTQYPVGPDGTQIIYPGRPSDQIPGQPSQLIYPVQSATGQYPGQQITGQQQKPADGKFSGQFSGDYNRETDQGGKFSGTFSGDYATYQNGRATDTFGGVPGVGTVQRPGGNGYIPGTVGQGTPAYPGYTYEPSGGRGVLQPSAYVHPDQSGQRPTGYVGHPGYISGTTPQQPTYLPHGQPTQTAGGAPQQPTYLPHGSPGQTGYTSGGAPAQTGYISGRVPGQTGYISGGAPQQTGYIPGGAPGQHGYITGGAPGQTGYVTGRAPGQTDYLPGGTPGQTEYIPAGAPGQTGYITGRAPEQTVYLPGGTPGQSGYIPGGAPGQSGYITGGTPGQPGYIPGGSPVQTGYITGGTPGQTGYIPGGTPGQTGYIPGGSPGQVGYTPGQTGNIYGGTPGQTGYIPGGTPGQTGYIPGGTPGQTGYIPGGTPGQTGYIPGGTSGQAGYISGGAPGPSGVQQPGYVVGPGGQVVAGVGKPAQYVSPPGAVEGGYYDQYGRFVSTAGRQVDDSDSQVETSVQQNNNETQASASAQGKYGGGTAQSQVSGTYSGSGGFSASAGSDDGSRGAMTQVSGGKEGAQSAAQGRGGLGQSQAQVQLNSDTGDTTSNAQTGGWNHGSQTQVQASGKGGMADAQANGPGSTSSQAQIGFSPYDEQDIDDQQTPFRGGGMASAQSSALSGQTQSQIQGKFHHGIKYIGAAQAGSGNIQIGGFNNQTKSSRLTAFKPINFKPSQGQTQQVSSTKPSSSHSSKSFQMTQNQPRPANDESELRRHATSRQMPSATETTSENVEINSTLAPEVDDYNDENAYDDYETEDETETRSDRAVITQKTENQQQQMALEPLEDLDATVRQSYGDTPTDGTLLQPGQSLPGSPGYQIPPGFRGRVKSIASGRNAYTSGKNSQAQSVNLTPGNGRIIYKRPVVYSVGSRTHNINGRYGYGSGYTYQPVRYQLKSGTSLPNFISVSKSETGSKNLYTGKKTPSVYYTQSSTCGVFTNTCVFNASGRVCFPKPKTNPDGTLMGC